eukprot:scaffold5343_cov179-Skeletonema_marinoi.AAC.3
MESLFLLLLLLQGRSRSRSKNYEHDPKPKDSHLKLKHPEQNGLHKSRARTVGVSATKREGGGGRLRYDAVMEWRISKSSGIVFSRCNA